MFKNYMANELGITKADIEEWTKESVATVAKDYIAHHFSESTLQAMMNKAALQWFEDNGNGWRGNGQEQLKIALAQEIMKMISIKIIPETPLYKIPDPSLVDRITRI